MLFALKELHHLRIIHRDVKPANLIYANRTPFAPVKVGQVRSVMHKRPAGMMVEIDSVFASQQITAGDK